MTLRRDFLAMTAGAVVAGAVLPLPANAKGAQIEPPLTCGIAGNWPRDIFPPGQHPALDYHGPSAPDEPDDAELIAALAEFDAIERHVNSHFEGGANAIVDDRERDAVIVPLWETEREPLERACRMRAVTLEGLQARARTIVLEDLDLDPEVDAITEGYTNDRLIAALLRDLLALGSTAA